MLSVVHKTVTGRGAPVPKIEQMTGPTIATVPFRFHRSQQEESVADALQGIQHDSIAAVPFEQVGLQNIGRLGACEATACDLQSFLVVQPEREEESLPPMFSDCQRSSAEGAFQSYALSVECQDTKSSQDIIATFDPAVIKCPMLERMIDLFVCIMKVTNDEALPMSKVPSLSPQDECQLEQWNGKVPEPVDCCVQSLINLNCTGTPEAMAVNSWDGRLTYHELDVQSSLLADELVEIGVGPEKFVPVYSDKSRWVVVGMLAIMKAGGAFVLLEASHPLQRLGEICHKVQAEVILVSAQYFKNASELAPRRLVLGEDGYAGRSETRMNGDTKTWDTGTTVSVQHHNAVYAVFTSESTGKPKGAVITHRAFSTSSKALSKALHIDSLARVFQFSSYAFDVSIADILVTLVGGELGANWAHMTPSVARLLSPDQIPSVKTLVLSGEGMMATEISTWAKHVNLINAYGPAECSVDCCVRSSIQPASATINVTDIGFATGCALWVVDANNHERLVPIGAEGELIVEGPIVGREYLHDVENTVVAFIESPSWQVKLGRQVASPLYKTGDIVQYNVETGSLEFLRRKDNQVKLRGQRLELGEVEHHLQRAYPQAKDVLAELVTLGDNAQTSVMVAFIVQNLGHQPDLLKSMDSLLLHPTEDFRSEVRAAKSRLRTTVPTYMIPTMFLALVSKPLTTNGKSDRRKLRETVTALTQEQMAAYTGLPQEKVMPSNAKEASLHSMLSDILGRPSSDIGMDDNFFHLGADSITAIKLASVLRRKAGLLMSVADVFSKPTLRGIASALTTAETVRDSSPDQNYSLLGLNNIRSFLVDTIAPKLSFPIEDVVDVLPASRFQDTCIRERSFTHFLVEIQGPVDQRQVQSACQGLIERHAILRTVFLQYNPPETAQVVLRHVPMAFDVHDEENAASDLCSALCAPGLSQHVQFGVPSVSFALVRSHDGSRQTLIIKISHAQYDGISMAFLYEDLLTLLCGETPAPATDFSAHVHQSNDRQNAAAVSWWRELLHGASMTFLHDPSTPTNKASLDHPPITISKTIPTPSVPAGLTLATLIKAAWAWTLSKHTNTTDILFGQLVTGRSTNNTDSRTVGPCINILPVRVAVPVPVPATAHHSLLTHIHTQHARSLPFESTPAQHLPPETATETESSSSDIHWGSILQHQNITEYPRLARGPYRVSTRARFSSRRGQRRS
ncbi:MAG: hypothetical protein Q9182_003807 [Xanthomendoza sp. 2 TL-2023]